MRVAFFEIEQWEVDYIKQSLPGFDLFFSPEKLDKDNLTNALRQSSGQADFDIISVFVGSNISKEVINALPDLKLITTRSTGFDHVDLKAAADKKILVAYVPGYGDNTVAEFAFGLILTLTRKIYEAADRLKEICSFSLDGLRGFDLAGKTIGIAGTGRIGRHMIKIAKGFEMNVIAFDVKPDENFAKEVGFKYVSFDELLANSDIISLHVPSVDSTKHLINSQNINKIKKGAILINTSRGAVVETDALIKGLNEGILAGAGLDVLEEEGVIADERELVLYGHPEEKNLKTVIQNHVLIDMPNVIVTPHNAFNTSEALKRILDIDLSNIKSFAQNGAPTYKA